MPKGATPTGTTPKAGTGQASDTPRPTGRGDAPEDASTEARGRIIEGEATRVDPPPADPPRQDDAAAKAAPATDAPSADTPAADAPGKIAGTAAAAASTASERASGEAASAATSAAGPASAARPAATPQAPSRSDKAGAGSASGSSASGSSGSATSGSASSGNANSTSGNAGGARRPPGGPPGGPSGGPSDRPPGPAPSGGTDEPPRGRIRVAFGIAVIALALGIAVLIWSHAKLDDAGQQIASLDDQIGQLQNSVQTLQSAPTQKPPPPQLPQAAKSEIATLKSGLAQAKSEIGTLQSNLATLQKTVEADHKSLAALSSSGADVPGLAAAAARNAKLAAAALALEIGEPLGTIPDAPKALSRYADTAPPTLASLRASFPAAARKAEAAGGTAGSGQGGLWKQIRHRVSSLVTVRKGDTVLAGSLASGTLAKAQAQLDAGDLQAAVKTLDGLGGNAKAAMGPWLTRAQHLLDARAAIATMAQQAAPPPAAGSAGGGSSGSANGSGQG